MNPATQSPPQAARSAATPNSSLSADEPWPGLAAFAEADQAFFFGREADIDELYRLIRRHRLTILFGRSGLGKTSLLQAGLFPRERAEDALPVYLRLDYSENAVDLGRQVIDATIAAAEACGYEAPSVSESDTLWEYFHRKDSDFWSDHHRIVLPLLVFDQFEEIFTIGNAARPDECRRFLQELSDLVEGRVPISVRARLNDSAGDGVGFALKRHHYKVVLSLREDYLAELETVHELMPSMLLNRFRLQIMNGAQALRVVTEPARAKNLVADDVAQTIVRYVADDPEGDADLAELDVDPPLLSLLCRKLNDRRLRRGEPQIGRDLSEEGAEILFSFYEESLDNLSDGADPRSQQGWWRGLNDWSKKLRARRFIEKQLIIEPEGLRDSRDRAEAESALGREVMEKLVDRRLLRIDNLFGRQRVELTHDVLTDIVLKSREKRRNWWLTRLKFSVLLALGAVLVLVAFWQNAEQQAENAQNRLGAVEEVIDSLKSQPDADMAVLAAVSGALRGEREPEVQARVMKQDSLRLLTDSLKRLEDHLATARLDLQTLEKTRFEADSVRQVLSEDLQTVRLEMAGLEDDWRQARAEADSLRGLTTGRDRMSDSLESQNTSQRGPEQRVPAQPTGLQATVAAGQIRLSWSDNSSSEEGFRIERCSDPECNEFREIGTTKPNEVSFTDTTRSAGVYTYRVRAFNQAGDSEYYEASALRVACTIKEGDKVNLSLDKCDEVDIETRYTVKPRLEDPETARRIVGNLYPRDLQEEGIEGSVTVQAIVDTSGFVLPPVMVKRSSGNAELDEAAKAAIQRFKYSPALNGDRKVAVLITQDIVFTVK